MSSIFFQKKKSMVVFQVRVLFLGMAARRMLSKKMKKIGMVLIILAVTAGLFCFFVKRFEKHVSKYSRNLFPSMIGGHRIVITDPEIKIFPPSVFFSSVSGVYESETVMVANKCKLEKPLSFVTGRVDKLTIKCDNGSVTENIVDIFREKKVPAEVVEEKEKTDIVPGKRRRSPGLFISIDDFKVMENKKSQRFKVDLSFENRSGVFRFRDHREKYPVNSGEILFSLDSKEAVLRFDTVSFDAVRSFFSVSYFDWVKGAFDGRVKFNVENGRLLAVTDISVKDLLIDHGFIDRYPFQVPFLRLSGELQYNLKEKSLDVPDLKISMGGIEGVFSGKIGSSLRLFELVAEKTSIMRLQTVIVDPLFVGFKTGGTIDMGLKYRQENGHFPEVDITGSLNDPVQYSYRMDYLKEEFIYKKDKNKIRDITVGPSNEYFVSIDEIPDHLVWAVVFSEDAGFFKHEGLDFTEISAAAKDNLTRSKMRGGSTITQQVVKNLFLGKEQTLMRKFMEMLLAIEIDATLSKDRLLEIYFNIVEWAPGVFGIGEASLYYFGKPPMELNVLESVYLASIIPGPYLYHRHFLQNNISDRWMGELHRLLDRLYEAEKITLDQHSGAMKGTIVFREIDREGGS